MRKAKALYVPPIKYPTDTSNFDPIENNKVIDTHNISPDKQTYNNANNNNNLDKIQNNNDFKNDATMSTNSNNNSKNQILYEFTFRRFFDEAYSEHFNVQSDNDENSEQNTPAIYV